ncbi:hypothetical protein TRAPUB_3683 [Trametes pubescens]|uniref:Uncharacterized protein n=1 Tax=Trametes pubescens TaxID=154538 RepID=A0A1M2VD61_TRAPU|nr:hypothetical protein TRAPUB_3683 [Trametes pubescens]
MARKQFFASSALARIDWQKWRPFPVLLLSVVVRVARPDHVEMDEADVGDGAVEREGRELPDIVAAGGHLLADRDDDSDGG